MAGMHISCQSGIHTSCQVMSGSMSGEVAWVHSPIGTKTDHVAQVIGLRGASGGGVEDAGVGQGTLEVLHGLSGLGAVVL